MAMFLFTSWDDEVRDMVNPLKSVSSLILFLFKNNKLSIWMGI